MDKNVFKIKLFLRAKSPEEAVSLMQKNNVINETMFEYDPPQYVDGEWIIWFRADVSKYKAIQ